MEEYVPFSKVYEALSDAVSEIEKNKDYLNDLDGIIGDSDHGEIVSLAFKKALEEVDKNLSSEDIGELFKIFGQELVFFGGGAMGPLYGTAFLDAGKALKGKDRLTREDIVKLITAFSDGVKRRGKCDVGEKTMYDTLYHAKEAAQEAFSQGASIKDMIKAIIKGAEIGMKTTKDLVSKRGRSSRLGERTKGHIDPGAASSYIFIKTFFERIAL